MKRFFIIFILLFVTVCQAEGETEVFEKIETYRFSGLTPAEMRQSLNLSSPVKHEGKTFHAHTTWFVKWYFQWIYEDGKYRINDANSTVEIKFIMPEWIDEAKAPTEVVMKWKQYFIALKQHEDGHAEIGIEAANAVVKAIRDVDPQPDSKQLEAKANAAANRVLERYRMQEIEYDRKTQHGEKTGAIFLP